MFGRFGNQLRIGFLAVIRITAMFAKKMLVEQGPLLRQALEVVVVTLLVLAGALMGK